MKKGKRDRAEVSHDDSFRRHPVIVSVILTAFFGVFLFNILNSGDVKNVQGLEIQGMAVSNSLQNENKITGQSWAGDASAQYSPLYFTSEFYRFDEQQREILGPNFERDFDERFNNYKIDLSALNPDEVERLKRDMVQRILEGKEVQLVCIDTSEKCYLNFLG